MAYIEQSDITNYIDAVNLAQMTADYGTDPINATINQTVLNNICQLASDVSDSLVSAVYTVPFQGPVPVKIYTSAIIFACEMLYARRLTPDEKNPFKAQADHWRNELMMINKGLLSLDYASQRAFTPIIAYTVPNRCNTNIF